MPTQIESYVLLIIKANLESSRGNDNFDLAAEGLEMGLNRYLTIKAVCYIRKCAFDEALRYVLANTGWRRLVEKRLLSDPECRKQAYQYCRRHPDNDLIQKEGDRYTVIVRANR